MFQLGKVSRTDQWPSSSIWACGCHFCPNSNAVWVRWRAGCHPWLALVTTERWLIRRLCPRKIVLLVGPTASIPGRIRIRQICNDFLAGENVQATCTVPHRFLVLAAKVSSASTKQASKQLSQHRAGSIAPPLYTTTKEALLPFFRNCRMVLHRIEASSGDVGYN